MEYDVKVTEESTFTNPDEVGACVPMVNISGVGLRLPKNTQVDIGLNPRTRVEGDDDVALFVNPATNRKEGVGESDVGMAGLLGADKKHGVGAGTQHEGAGKQLMLAQSGTQATSGDFESLVKDSLEGNENKDAMLENVGPLEEAQVGVTEAPDKGGQG
ncbi:hypothetical protein RHMOL_Rhmol07G0296200 [Rhododendron molle]|uniref:Uncharacterized protein n=1 Tax=Rhododendron molle TaxID=49168 RepID=A0ACC0N7N1_RHOML|nr:hypothetical protein RHMOL_Rhmol07G0296200 [Rhododendron molle]